MERHQTLLAAAIAVLAALGPMQVRAQNAAVGTDFAVERDNAPVPPTQQERAYTSPIWYTPL